MIEYGAQITCDACGANQFKNGANSQFDFAGWEKVHDMDLCPECSKSLHNVVAAWIDEHGGNPYETH